MLCTQVQGLDYPGGHQIESLEQPAAGQANGATALRCPFSGQNGAAGSVTERQSICGAAIRRRARDERDEQEAARMTISTMARRTARADASLRWQLSLRALRPEPCGRRLPGLGGVPQSEHDGREFVAVELLTDQPAADARLATPQVAAAVRLASDLRSTTSGSSPDGDARQRYEQTLIR